MWYETELKPRPQNKILLSFKFFEINSRQGPPSLLYGSSPSLLPNPIQTRKAILRASSRRLKKAADVCNLKIKRYTLKGLILQTLRDFHNEVRFQLSEQKYIDYCRKQ